MSACERLQAGPRAPAGNGRSIASSDGQHPHDRCAVFERHRYRDLDYHKIAAELGITVRQVERHYAAAMLHIMRCTEEDGGS